MSKSTEQFGLEPETYDALVDWDRRLANEESFYRELFAQVPVRRLLDAACGTGRHAAWWHSWGLEVEGADVDERMVAHCRRRWGEPDGLRWVRRSYETPPEGEPFDAVVCVGNSLSLARDDGTLERALGAMLAALRSGGVLVVQVLNLWRLAEGPSVWQKCKLLPADGAARRLIVKGVHRAGERAFIDVLQIEIAGSELRHTTHSASFLGIRREQLEQAARAGGATRIEFFGSFAREPYQPGHSPDLILAARRG